MIPSNLSFSLPNADRIREYKRCLEMNSTILKFNNQDYFKIKKECKEEGKLFLDDTFNTLESIRNIDEIKNYKIVWQRPFHITNEPKFRINESKGVVQGILGNCWLVAAFASLVSQQKLWDKVVPNKNIQNFNHDDYCGIFMFRFWRFGFWIEVVVDDLLPTIDNKLAFAHSDSPNEFWCALCEKVNF